ncbi:hypothetical protein [Amphritea pacifica]|uniref:Uncharacterized protein n=1 Tax=Amphritea pacifica TaxID=2811233 RepID=A0ABS2WB03_9GAMM|nr:hypothetical protein [Amphritea pacifica]MBN0988910.1 hypothetical protein [Amphritea pacifica]
MDTNHSIQEDSEFSRQSPVIIEDSSAPGSMTKTLSRATEYLRSLADDPDENCFVLSSN